MFDDLPDHIRRRVGKPTHADEKIENIIGFILVALFVITLLIVL